MGCDLAGALGGRRAGGDRLITDRAVRCLPDGRSGEGLRRDCGRRMRTFREPAQFDLLLSGGAITGVGGMGRARVSPEWAGVRAYRSAASICAGGDSRTK